MQVSANWQCFTVAFSELVLEHGRRSDPSAFKASGVLSVRFGFEAGQSYDLNFDDVAFMNT